MNGTNMRLRRARLTRTGPSLTPPARPSLPHASGTDKARSALRPGPPRPRTADRDARRRLRDRLGEVVTR